MNSVKTKKIYLLRHGAIQKFDRKTYIGQLDLPLNQEGVQQAKAWRRFFQNNLPQNIFCSDLTRCVTTAKIIAGPFTDRICIKKEFREISLGLWEGVTMEDIRKKFPEQWMLRGKNMKYQC